MTYESTAEPIKIGCLMDFLLSDDYPKERRDDLTIPFGMVLGDALDRGHIDRPIEVVYREVEGLPKGTVKAVIDVYEELVDAGVDQYDEANKVGQEFLDRYQDRYGRRPAWCVPVVKYDVARTLLQALTDAHPLSPRGVKEALERVKMLPAASGAPGTRVSFGNWTRRAWMGAGYFVARQLDADGVNSHLVDRFGEE
jgi:hypothetical protein